MFWEGERFMEVQKRKLEINLKTIGTGVILFGVWTFVKFAVNFMLFGSELDEAIGEKARLAFIIVAWIGASLDALSHLYIGMSAKAEGGGKRKGRFFLGLTAVITVLYALVLPVDVAAIFLQQESLTALIVTFIIDATATVFLAEVFLYTVKLRRLRKETETGGAAA